MTNAKFDNVEDYRDIETLAEYERLQNTGGDLKQFIEDQKTVAREITEERLFNGTTLKTEFSTAEPWLKVNDNHVYLNAAAQEKTNSVLNYFRKMVQLHKDNSVLVYGMYTLLDEDNPDIYAYTRVRR
jgi:oligo-1,6-glucosidase